MNITETIEHGAGVFVFSETITPVVGREDELLDVSLRTAELVKEQPGLIQYMLTKSDASDCTICSTAVWAQKSDFQNFMKSDAVAALLMSEDMAKVRTYMSDYKSMMSSYIGGWHPH